MKRLLAIVLVLSMLLSTLAQPLAVQASAVGSETPVTPTGISEPLNLDGSAPTNHLSGAAPLPDMSHDTLASLLTQLGTLGIASEPVNIIYPSGMVNDIRVSYELVQAGQTAFSESDTISAQVQFTLSVAAAMPVSFQYEAIPASATLGQHLTGVTSGTVTFAAGETEQLVTIDIAPFADNPGDYGIASNADAFWTGERYFHLYCDNISGALFEGDRYTLTVPVPIWSAHNLQTVYQSAISTSLIDLDTISGANAPGIYTVTGGAITPLTLTAEIAGDVRTMLDAGVLSHIRMPEGYFLNETGATGTIETRVYVYQHMDSFDPTHTISHLVTMPGSLEEPPPPLPYSQSLASADSPQSRPVSDLFLGPSSESNGIKRRLDFIFDTSSLSAPVSICFLDNQDTYLRHQIRFSDEQAPEVSRIDIGIPSGIRYGDLVPVTVVFNEPVRTDNITLTLEGTVISPLEVSGTISNAISFLYEADDSVVGDSNLTVSIDRVSGAVDLSGKTQGTSGPFTSNSAAVIFNAPDPEQYLAYCADPVVSVNQGTSRNAAATIAIPVQRDGNLSNWLLDPSRVDGNNGSTVFKARVIAATSGAIDVPLTIHTDDLGVLTGFSGAFTAPENTTGTDLLYAMELYLDKTGTGIFSRIHALDTLYTVPPLILIDETTDISLDYTRWPPTDTLSADGAASLSLGYNLQVAASWQDAAYFSWTSSNHAVASITNTGIITLTGTPGTATFTLTVSNPLTEPAYAVTSRTLTVQAAQAAYLYVPAGLAQQERLRGSDAVVDFATNLHDRNAQYAGQSTETDFTFTLYQAVYTGGILDKGTALFTEMLPATTTTPRKTYTVGSEYLRDSTPKGVAGYVLEIRAEDRQTGQTLSVDVRIRVRDLPATAVLVRPEKRYMTDKDGSAAVRFDIENKTADTEYLLSVSRNNESTPAHTSSDPSGVGQMISVPIPYVDAGRLLDVYTVTLKARNPSDETWSYDSYLFYVYNDNALEIFVNGLPNPRSMTVQTDFPDGVVAYSTDIWWHTTKTGLLDWVGINKTEYAWSNVADKIFWSVDGDSVSLWYASGYIRERIDAENGIHLPGTSFTMEADEAGHSVVTATHVLTGMSDRLLVDVSPIHDKLFMFQAYPPMPCNIRYTNGDGVARSYTTTALGQLTVHENSGITGDVLFYPTGDDQEIYDYGVLRSGKMAATQQTVGRFAAYPRNIVLLPQRQHRVSLSLQNQETGAPYTGPVVLRGGLYLNDTYQPQTTVNGAPGNIDQTISADTTGRYAIDLAATGVTDNHELTPEDRVSYVLEARFPNNAYRPVFIRIDAKEVLENRASPRGVDRLQAIHPVNGSAIDNSVIVVSEKLSINGESMSFEALNFVDDIPVNADLALELIVSGGYRPSYEVGLVDETGAVRSLTTVARSEAYPFADTTILSGATDIASGLLNILRHYDDPGTRFNLYPVIRAPGLEIRLSKPIQIQNLMNVPMMAEGLADSFADTEALLADVQADGYYPVDDSFVGDALDFISYYDMDFGKTAGLEIIPTDDPLVYKGIFRFAVGTYDRDNPSGVFVASGEDQKFSYMPGFSDVKAMKKGEFLKKSKATMNKFKDTSKGFYYSYGGGAYVECEIYYDVGEQEWMMRLLTSDTYIGGGGGYYYNVNGSIGPVPVTATLKAGMTATVGLKIYTEEDGATTYITYLYPGTNIYVFGGIGFDYDVVSFKAGPYGMLEHNQEYYWVNNNERDGQRFSIYGEVGIEFEVKLLFIGYNAKWKWGDDDDSWYYGDWAGIYVDYFIPKEIKEALRKGWPPRMTISSSYLSAAGRSGTLAATGTDGPDSLASVEPDDTGVTGIRLIPVTQSVSYEERDYLTAGERVWLSVPVDDGLLRAAPAFSLLSAPSDAPETGITDIWQNAYPHASPVLTEDAALLAYLSDMGSTDLLDTAVCFSDKTAGAFPEGTQLDASDYPDSNLALAGTAANAVAVWNRTFTTDFPAAGSNATAEDLVRAMSATEVMAGVRRDGAFHTTRLTDNATPDLGPVVATSGDHAIALWRAVSPGDLSSPLDFTSDTIQYRLYNGTSGGSGWQEAATLYDGSLNKATGVNAAMLPDGRAAVVYQVSGSDDTGAHIVCSVLNADGSVVNTLRVSDMGDTGERAGTSLANLAPLVTTAHFPDGEQRFVVGWQVTDGTSDSETATGPEAIMGSDSSEGAAFQLAAINADGSVYPEFGLTLTGDMGAVGNPRFTQGAQDIEDLSLIWTESDLDADYAPDGTRRDLIMGRKLVRASDGTLSATGRLLLEPLAPYTTAESFDPIVDPATGLIHTALLQTVHGTTGNSAVMASAVSQYRNTLTVTPAFAHEDVLPGLDLPVQFTVANEGVEPVTTLSITLDGVTGTFADVNIAPDETRGLTLLRAPASPVADMTYTVTARYPTLAEASHSGVLNLSLPDAGIQSVSLSRETARERGFHLLLENNAAGDLVSGRHVVRLEVHDSPNFTLPGYDGTPLYTRVFSDAASLDTLNTEDLPVNLILDATDLARILNAEGEIPAGGVNLYFRTILLENGEVVEDADPANDMAYRRIRSLAENTGTPVSLASLMESENGLTRVRVDAFNNTMSPIANGNLTISLKDAGGRVLETRQTYQAAEPGSLLAIAGESAGSADMTFPQEGASVDVTFSRVATDSTQLSALNLLGVPLSFNKAVYAYNIQTYDLTQTVLTAVAENPASTISATLNGSQVAPSQPIPLRNGLNTFIITVTTGTVALPYAVNVTNQIGSGETPGQDNDDDDDRDATNDDADTYRARLSLPGLTTSLEIVVDNVTGRAVINLGDWVRTFFQNDEDAVLTLPDIPGVTSYTCNIPADAMTGAYGKAALTVQTALGSLRIPSGMLADMTGPEGKAVDLVGKTAGLTIANGNSAALSALSVTELAAIGDRPLLALTLTLDGIPTDWNNPTAPATVRIPYTPTTDELKNPESLVIWYIDNAGRVVAVPNGHYDTDTGTVVFQTTHFSTYAVAYNNISFHDVPGGTWYETAVRFIAARDITKGTGGGHFSPNAKLTRGDFLVMLMRSHGIEPDATPSVNFADAGNTYYTGYLAAAKALGISAGVGDNRFVPEREITRQEMFTLLYNALKTIGQLPHREPATGSESDVTPSSASVLTTFSDAADISPWAAEAMALLVHDGIVNGGDGMLMPQQGTTRAEMAQVLYNLLGIRGLS